MDKILILHALTDGRVGGPGARITRVHQYLHSLSHGSIHTLVACPAVQPVGYYNRLGLNHAEIYWEKPKLEHPMSSGIRWGTTGFLRNVFKSYTLCRNLKPSIVHVNGAILMPVVIGALFARVPLVWHLNDTTVPRLFATLVKFISSLTDIQVIAASSAVVQYYGLHEETEVLYPPAPSVDEKLSIRHTDCRYIGVMANLSPGKGLEYIIEAFAQVARVSTDVRLKIAGRVLENKRWYYNSLVKLSKQLGVTDKLIFEGFVENHREWYETLDLFVFSSEFEAAPVAVIEAMTFGVPVVAADIPATREILGGCGTLTPMRDTTALARAIQHLLDNLSLRQSFIQKGLERTSQTFSLQLIGKQYFKLYSSLLRNSYAVIK